jgi:MSHA biogenesis protein MshK
MRHVEVFVGLCLAAPLTLAQNLADPTRPPPAFDRSQADSGTAVTGPVLQSVLLGAGRSEAIISGQVVRTGEKFGDAQVIKITEAEVVLRNGKELQTVKLFPNIEKRLTYSHTSAKPGKRGQEN